MTYVKTIAALAAGAAALAASALAGDVVAIPADYSVQAESYVESRLSDPRGARIEIVSEPYRVEADLKGHPNLEGWGVDIRVKSRLPTGSYGGTMSYTVIFVDGEPVALCDDTDQLTKA